MHPIVTSHEVSEKNELVLHWSDGKTTRYPVRDLRIQCPCAHCVNEWTGTRQLDPNSIPETIGILDVSWVGRYALRVSWSDGHNTGIYTFKSLRDTGEFVNEEGG